VSRDPIEQLRGGLVVSCQAPPTHPLHDPQVMGLLAQCAELGGAVGVRINGPDDVRAAKVLVDVPVIGLHKVRQRSGRDLITPGIRYAVELVAAGADILAVEATREAPDDPFELIRRIRSELGVPVMADVSTVDEALLAWDAGAELIGSTLSGYTAYTNDQAEPDVALVAELSAKGMRAVAEGRYATARDVEDAFDAGAWAVVVGTAITDPVAITRQLVLATPRAKTDDGPQ
jgi:N-acylglucosamine-6-phosphate 2-epimerase